MDFAINLNPGGVGFYDPDLSAFQERGGKIIAYHGRIDQTITSRLAMDYHNRIQAALNLTIEDMQDFYQLFLIPGHSHCTGGPGAWNFGQTFPMDPERLDAENNALLSLVEWVENDRTPESLVGSKHVDDDIQSEITAQRSRFIRFLTLSFRMFANFQQSTARILYEVLGTAKVIRTWRRAGPVEWLSESLDSIRSFFKFAQWFANKHNLNHARWICLS